MTKRMPSLYYNKQQSQLASFNCNVRSGFASILVCPGMSAWRQSREFRFSTFCWLKGSADVIGPYL